MQDAKNPLKCGESLTAESVEKFRAGDEREFSRIYSGFRDDLYRFIQRWIANPETAEELMQEVFVRVYRFRKAYDPARSLGTWLRAIARNAVTDWLRANRARREAIDPARAGEAPAMPCGLPTAELLLVQKVERRELRRVMKALTSRQRRVLWLRAFRGLSYFEIAEELDLSLAAVKAALHRARRSLLVDFDFAMA